MDPEVGNLHLAVPRDEHVGRIDVAVDDRGELAGLRVLRGVRGGERVEDAPGDEHRGAVVEDHASGPDEGAQPVEGHAVDVLEHHDELPGVREEVEELHDRGMRQARVRRGLPGEHALERLVVPVLLEEQLENDDALVAMRRKTR
jgi:hypothetical protein